MPPLQPPRPGPRPLVREEPASIPPAIKHSLSEAETRVNAHITRVAADIAGVYERKLDEERKRFEGELAERDGEILKLRQANLAHSEAMVELRGDIERKVSVTVTAELSKRFPDRPEVKATVEGAVHGDKAKSALLTTAIAGIVAGIVMGAPSALKGCSEVPKEFAPQGSPPPPDPSMPAGAPRK